MELAAELAVEAPKPGIEPARIHRLLTAALTVMGHQQNQQPATRPLAVRYP